MKRDKNLHSLSRDHHAALTSVVLTRRHLRDGTDRERLIQIADEFSVFYATGLLPHFRQEEEWLLPRYLRYVPANDPDVIRLLTEHVALHRLVLDLSQANALGLDLGSPLEALTDCLESHVRFEERELFPKIEAALESSELQELGKYLMANVVDAIVIPGGDGCKIKLNGLEGTDMA